MKEIIKKYSKANHVEAHIFYIENKIEKETEKAVMVEGGIWAPKSSIIIKEDIIIISEWLVEKFASVKKEIAEIPYSENFKGALINDISVADRFEIEEKEEIENQIKKEFIEKIVEADLEKELDDDDDFEDFDQELFEKVVKLILDKKDDAYWVRYRDQLLNPDYFFLLFLDPEEKDIEKKFKIKLN
jgi:hypothetical protein